MPSTGPPFGTSITLRYNESDLSIPHHYNHDSDSDSSNSYIEVTIRLLSSDNYIEWASEVWAYLHRLRSLDALYHCRLSELDLHTQTRNAPTVIHLTMSHDHYNTYTKGKYKDMTVAQLWRAIETDERKHYSPLYERIRLYRIRFEEYTNVHDYLSALRTSIKRLEYAKSTEKAEWKMPEDEECFLILNGLPKGRKWETVRATALTGEMLSVREPKTFVRLLRAMYSHSTSWDIKAREKEEAEKEGKMKEGSKKGMAKENMMAKDTKMKKGSERMKDSKMAKDSKTAGIRCYRCKEKGHMKRDCPK